MNQGRKDARRLAGAAGLPALETYGDYRMFPGCIYCSDSASTRDHLPPKVLLDEPYPNNLQTVGACLSCNNASSADETYLACMIDCVLAGHPDHADRAVVRDALRHSPALAADIALTRKEVEGQPVFHPDIDRIKRTVLKIARGHVAYELHEKPDEDPIDINVLPLPLMSPQQREEFERHPGGSIWPEVGSRAMSRMAVAVSTGAPLSWLVVQPGRYRYLAAVGDGRIVRMVLSEYLACEVVWNF